MSAAAFLRGIIMALVFLAGYASGSRKRRLQDGPKTKSEKVTFPSPPWLRETLQKYDAQNLLVRSCQKVRSTDNTLNCPVVVSVAAGSPLEGPLTPWSREERFLWFTDARPYDAYSLRILSAVCLAPEARAEAGRRSRSVVWSPKVPMSVNGVTFSKAGHDAVLTQPQVLEVLGVSDAAWAAFLQKPVCMLVPSPALLLICKGEWRALMCRGHLLHTNSQPAAKQLQTALAYPSQAWLQRLVRAGRLRGRVQRQQLALQPSHASDIAFHIKSTAVALVQAAEEDKRGQLTMELERMVMRLDDYGDVCFKSARASVQFDPHKILQSLSAAMNLKNRSHLKKTVCRALAGASGCPEVVDLDLSSLRTPSGPTLSRKQILVDAALCCHWARTLQRHIGPIYLYADSSPQVGADWLMSIVMLIRDDDLERCVGAADYLKSSAEEFKAAVAANDDDRMHEVAQKRHAEGVFLQSAIKHHKQLPMGLGSGRTTMEHKCRSLCRKFFAEAQTLEHTQKVLQQVQCFCTDMGTELGIADMGGCTLTSVLPSWMVEHGVQQDQDVALPQPLGPLADAFVFPDAVVSPGLLHICSNMTKDVDKSMEWWSSFFTGFKAIAQFMNRKFMRQRFIGFCLKNTPYAWLESKFQEGVPNPVDWRWGVLVSVLDKILPLGRHLRKAWDPVRFKKGPEGFYSGC